MGDCDDDEQVENYSDHRDEGQDSVQERGFRPGQHGLSTGAVEELWKTELNIILDIHH